MAKAVKLKMNGDICYPVSVASLIVTDTDKTPISDKLENVETSMNKIKTDVSKNSTEITTITQDVVSLSSITETVLLDVDELKNRKVDFTEVNARIDEVDGKFAEVNSKITDNESRITEVNKIASGNTLEIQETKRDILDNKKSIENLNTQISAFTTSLEHVQKHIDVIKNDLDLFTIDGGSEINVEWNHTDTQNDVNLSLNNNSVDGGKMIDKTIGLEKLKDFYIDIDENIMVVNGKRYRLVVDGEHEVEEYTYSEPTLTIQAKNWTRDENGKHSIKFTYTFNQTKLSSNGVVVETISLTNADSIESVGEVNVVADGSDVFIVNGNVITLSNEFGNSVLRLKVNGTFNGKFAESNEIEISQPQLIPTKPVVEISASDFNDSNISNVSFTIYRYFYDSTQGENDSRRSIDYFCQDSIAPSLVNNMYVVNFSQDECEAFTVRNNENGVLLSVERQAQNSHNHSHSAQLSVSIEFDGVICESNVMTFTQEEGSVEPDLNNDEYYIFNGYGNSTPTNYEDIIVAEKCELQPNTNTTVKTVSGYKSEWIAIPSDAEILSWTDTVLGIATNYNTGNTVTINSVDYTVYYITKVLPQGSEYNVTVILRK